MWRVFFVSVFVLLFVCFGRINNAFGFFLDTQKPTFTVPTITTLREYATQHKDFHLATGNYKANGNIRSIDGLGFQPDVVIVKGNTPQYAVWRSDAMSGDSTAYVANAAGNFTGGITSLDGDGFTIGTNAVVNTTGVMYYYIAFGDAGNGDIKTGSYSGNGIAGTTINGVGFSPALMWIKRNGNNAAVWRSSDFIGDLSSFFNAAADTNNQIQSFQTDGFQIGSDARVNTNSSTYYYVAFKANSSEIASGSYTGDGTDDRSITGLGLQPDFAWIKDTAATNGARFKPDSLPGDSSFQFTAASDSGNLIQTLLTDGFQIGSNAAVNKSGATYRYVAFHKLNTTPYVPNVHETNLFNDFYQNVNTFNSNFGSAVQNGDFVQVVNGNCGNTLNSTKAISDYQSIAGYLNNLGKSNITYGIYTSDLTHVQSLASAVATVSGITYIGYGYEPGCGAEFPSGNFSSGFLFSNALANLTTAKTYATNAGKQLMFIPTGRPLINDDLAGYGWDYGQFIAPDKADYMIVQTQTWASQGVFQEAMDELRYELLQHSINPSVVFSQVTIDPTQSQDVNGVDATTAYNSVLEGQNRGLYNMSLWYSTAATTSALSYLSSVSTLNTNQILGPANLTDGETTTNTSPTLSFFLSDPDTADTVKYRIQIASNSAFLSPIVDYTSDLMTQGTTYFTIGQAAGTGIYNIGSSGQTLSPGSYYWRVKTIDSNNEQSFYTPANTGAVAFTVISP